MQEQNVTNNVIEQNEPKPITSQTINIDNRSFTNQYNPNQNMINRRFDIGVQLEKAQEIQQKAQVEYVSDNRSRRDMAKQVIEKMTNITGTPQEIAAHNEMLSRCIMGDKNAQASVKSLIKKIAEQDLQLVQHGEESKRLVNYIYKNYYGLGPIEDLVNDPTINEIWVNSWNHIWIEKNGIKQRVSSRFKDDEDIMRIIRLLLQFNKQDISVQDPMKESRMLNGSRITIMIPPVSKHPCINIRKFEAFDVSTENLLEHNSVNQEIVEWLKNIVKGRANIMIIGETGSGKTSFLKWLIGMIDENYRLGTIETNFELNLEEKYPNRNIFPYEEHLELGISMNDLFKKCLRSSPDIIICGEARGVEAGSLIAAMRRGHPGSIGTIHTNSPETTVSDVAEMINEDGQRRDTQQLLYRVASAIDIIIQLRRYDDGTRRVSRISEVVPDLNTLTYKINDIFVFEQDKEDANKGNFKKLNSLSSITKKKMMQYGVLESQVDKM